MLPTRPNPKIRGKSATERLSNCAAVERWRLLGRSLAIRRAARLLSLAAVLFVAFVWTPEAQAGGVVSTCDEAHLNSALAGGGAVTFSCSGTITLTSAITISANTSIDGTGQTVTVSGGGAVQVFIVNFGVTLSLTNLTIANGNVLFSGGIHNIGTLIVSNSTFLNNLASAGAIYNDGGTVVVTNSTFSANTAYGGGGGIQNSGGSLAVTNSTFSGNFADVNGGGIYNDSDGTLTVTNSTFWGNTATYSGGGIYTAGGPVKLLNTVLANSSASGGECGGTITDGGYNLSDDATCAFSATGSSNSVSTASLNLGTLASNGGPTQTIALATGSVAIDAIPAGTNGCGASVAEDQRGTTRPQNFKCDIGAYEVVPAPTTVVGRDDTPCNEAALEAAVAAGGLVTFNCPIPTTITLTSGITVSKNTAIDGTGQSITISGGGSVEAFSVNSGVHFSVNNLTIANGHSFFDGGGIFSNHGTLTVTNSTFSGNTVGRSGGGIVSGNSGLLIVTNSTFSGNSAGFGGGIYSDGTLTTTNSTFSGNTASRGGGGIINSDGKVAITNSTFSGNTAPAGFGGGIDNSGGTVKLQNTILANSASGGDCSGAITDGGYNLADDSTCSFTGTGDMNNTAAGLDPGGLKNNGGPTQTIALQSTSPAIDAIPVSACTDVSGIQVITDQRGVFRPQGTGCDIGAFELIPVFLLTPTVSFTGNPGVAVYGSTFTMTATTNASTTPTLTASGACSISQTSTTTGQVTMTSGTGSCMLTASWPADSTYAAAMLQQSTGAEKAPLTVTANDATCNSGTSNPAFSASYTGFVNGDNASALTGSPSLTTAASCLTSPAGPYTITAAVGTLSSANYAFTFVNGTLTITAPPPPPAQVIVNEPIKVTDTPTFPDVFDPEPIKVTDTPFITPLIQVGAPVAEFSESSLGFNGQNGSQTITASDIGLAPLTLASATISGSAQFGITQIGCSNGATSAATMLPSGGACALTITYTASATPAADNATLTFTDNAALSNLATAASGSNYTQSIPLNGGTTTIGPPPPPPAVIPVMDNETIHVADTQLFPDVFDSETVHVTDAVMVTALNTSTGPNIVVTPTDTTTGSTPATVTFSSVTQPGNTTLATSSSGPAAPAGFQLGTPPVYYNLATTATYAGMITVCINYAGISFPSGMPSLWHYSGGAWVNITASVNTVTTTVCGTTSSLSPFALFQPAAPPFVKILPAASNPVSITTDGSGNYIVNFTVINQGNVSVDLLSLTAAKLGAAALSAARVSTITSLAAGASGTFTLTFPAGAGAAGTKVAFSASGSYSAGTLSGNWSFGTRAIFTLP